MSLVADAIAPNLRRAALALHALSPADRAWVFERLGEPQRVVLQPLLAELAELGIPPDLQLVRQALAQGDAGNSPAADPQDLDPAALLRTIRSEPPSMRPLLLAVLSEPQRQPLRAQGLEDVAPAARVLPTALRESLLRALRARSLSEVA